MIWTDSRRAAPKTAYSELVFASKVVPKDSLVVVLNETVRQLAADPEYRRSQEQLLRGFMRLYAPSFDLLPAKEDDVRPNEYVDLTDHDAVDQRTFDGLNHNPPE